MTMLSDIPNVEGKIVRCVDCKYEGIRWNDNLRCKRCGGLCEIVEKQC